MYNFQNGEVVPIGTSYSGVFNLSSPPMYFDGSYNAPTDIAPLKVLNPQFQSAIGLVMISVVGLSVLFSFLTMSIVIIYRESQVIKASSPLFCCLELFGFILLYLSTIMGLDIPTKFLCIAQPVTLNIGFVLVVSNIVAKNFRIYRIFHNIYVTKRVIRDSHLLKIVGSILGINLIIMILWFSLNPPILKQVILPDFTTYWTCDGQTGSGTPYFVFLFVYNVMLLLVATYLAYMNRNVAANYNECRQISFVVYNILLNGCVALPTVFLPADQYFTKFFLSNVMILFGTTFSLVCMFLPKLLKLFAQIEKSKQDHAAAVAAAVAMSTSGGGGGGGLSGIGGGGGGNLISINGGTSHIGDDTSVDSFLHQSNSGGNQWINGVPTSVSQNGRKASVTTLEGDTSKEAHAGYMGFKFQRRLLPFLSSWKMRRIILFPHSRYFDCFESGKPETTRAYAYLHASIHSRTPGCYILKIKTASNKADILLQVQDDDRLMHWFNLFESKQQGVASSYISTGAGNTGSGGGSGGGVSTGVSSSLLTPQMNNLLPMTLNNYSRPSLTPAMSTGESDQTLHTMALDPLTLNPYSSRHLKVTGTPSIQPQPPLTVNGRPRSTSLIMGHSKRRSSTSAYEVPFGGPSNSGYYSSPSSNMPSNSQLQQQALMMTQLSRQASPPTVTTTAISQSPLDINTTFTGSTGSHGYIAMNSPGASSSILEATTAPTTRRHSIAEEDESEEQDYGLGGGYSSSSSAGQRVPNTMTGGVTAAREKKRREEAAERLQQQQQQQQLHSHQQQLPNNNHYRPSIENQYQQGASTRFSLEATPPPLMITSSPVPTGPLPPLPNSIHSTPTRNIMHSDPYYSPMLLTLAAPSSSSSPNSKSYRQQQYLQQKRQQQDLVESLPLEHKSSLVNLGILKSSTAVETDSSSVEKL